MWGTLSSLPSYRLIHEKSRGVPGIRGTPLAGERMVWRQEWMVALGSGSFGGGRVQLLNAFSFNPSSSGFLTKRPQDGAAGHPYTLDEIFSFFVEFGSAGGKKYSKF